MTFARVLRGMRRCHERFGVFHSLLFLVAGHLNDDLNPALIGDPVRQQFSHRRRKCVLAAGPEGRRIDRRAHLDRRKPGPTSGRPLAMPRTGPPPSRPSDSTIV